MNLTGLDLAVAAAVGICLGLLIAAIANRSNTTGTAAADTAPTPEE